MLDQRANPASVEHCSHLTLKMKILLNLQYNINSEQSDVPGQLSKDLPRAVEHLRG